MNAVARLTPLADSNDLTVEALRGVDAFLALKREWDGLFARAGRPQQLFQQHALLGHWAKSYPDAAAGIAIVTVRAGGRLAAVAPLVLSRTLGVTRMRLMGAPVAQFDDMLIDAECGADAGALLWRAIGALGADVFETRRVRADSALAAVLPAGGVVTEMSQAPFACLSSRVDGGAPGPAYPAKERSNFRRRQRRLAETGALAMTSHRAGEQASLLAARAIEIKRRALKAAGIVSPAVRSCGFETFFRLAAADPRSGLLATAIEIDGQPVAIDLSFLCKSTAFGHVLATEPAMVQKGVGNLLVHHVFATARAAGARTFDLLPPADAYKMHHADATTPVQSAVYPFTARGRLFARAFHGTAIPLARRAMRALAKG